jgi:hypothetical protein
MNPDGDLAVRAVVATLEQPHIGRAGDCPPPVLSSFQVAAHGRSKAEPE